MTEVATEVKKPGTIVGAGAVTSFSATVIPNQEQPQNGAEQAAPEGTGGKAATAEDTKSEGTNGTGQTAAAAETGAVASTEQTAPALTDDQITKFLKEKGIEVNSLEDIRNKFKPELSPEEKIKSENERELKVIEYYVQNGGSVEQYNALKSVSKMDLGELSNQAISQELKDAGFNGDEIKNILAERYYQIKLDEIEQKDDETTEEFNKRKAALEKKVKFGTEKMTNRGKSIQEKAISTLNTLTKAFEDSNRQTLESIAEEKELSSKVDEISSKIEKKVTLKLEPVSKDAPEPAPIEFDVQDSDLAEVSALLKDEKQRNNILYTEDGKLNVASIFNVLLENKNLKRALNTVYHEGGTRQVEIFQSMFPLQAKEIGVGKAPANKNQGVPGKITGAGKPEVFRP